MSAQGSTGLALVDHIFLIVERARDATSACQGWRRRGLLLGAGGASVLAMAPFFFWPILFFTFPVLVWLIDDNAAHASSRRLVARRCAHDGWWFGFGYFLFGLYWIGEAFLVEADIFGWLMPFAVTIMPAGLALFFAGVTGLAGLLWTTGLARLFLLAAIFGAGEWVRGHIFTGFPWNTIGYAFTYPLSLMQSASLVGVYGLTPWVVLACSSPVVAVSDRVMVYGSRLGGSLLGVALAAVPIGALWIYGATQIASGRGDVVEGVTLRLVQPSVPQRDKWLNEKQSGIFADHILLSKTNGDGRVDDAAGVTHVIWPEASMPFLPLRHPAALTRIGEMLPPDAVLIAGALRVEDAQHNASEQIPYDERSAEQTPVQQKQPRVYNSLMVFDSDGRLATLYDKTHLVPFGEYLPFRAFLESVGLQTLTRLRGGFEIGPKPRPLMTIAGLSPVGPLICYEAIFPGAVVSPGKRANVLINVTNDGWFGNTTGPQQHFHQARVRAVEEGVPLIRSANNGISAVVDPRGRIIAMLGLNERGSVDSALPKPLDPTVFATHGFVPFWIVILVFVLIGAYRQFRSFCDKSSAA